MKDLVLDGELNEGRRLRRYQILVECLKTEMVKVERYVLAMKRPVTYV